MRVKVEAVGESTSLADRKRRAGQRLILGLPGPGLDHDTRQLIREIRPFGFILFARNVEEPAQVRELNRELTSLLPTSHPPLHTIDQEGGRVQRVRNGATLWPPARWLGNLDDPKITAQLAAGLSRELRAMGFHINWAPCADVNSNPKNPVIGDRSFGDDAAKVSRHLLAWMKGASSEGITSCVKHFPGHGDTHQDSHLTLPIVEKERPQLEAMELRPFREAVAAGVPGVMSAHVVFPAYDEDHPATLSRRLLAELLRGELGFKGVIFSDDMDMKAVADRFPIEQAAARACAATVDVFLACKELPRQLALYEALIRLEEEDIRYERLGEDSERRTHRLREQALLGLPPAPELNVLNAPADKALVEWVRARGAEEVG
jgi:beta-N-acetylhexosaminidase